VRADLPRGEAILYYNEAYPVIADEKCDTGGDFDPNRKNFSYPRVPEGLDWISVDYYPDEGTYLLRTIFVYKPKDLRQDWSPRFSTLQDKNGWIGTKIAGTLNLGVS
jgi:hypothetical protein